MLASCNNDEVKPDQALYNQVSGEWNIDQIIFPANDSTITPGGQAVFEDCEVYQSGQCEGYFSIDNEVVNFRYQVTQFSDIPSQITIGPLEQHRNNTLGLQIGSFDILTIDRNHLTIDLAFCTYDADSSCITTHRHIVMTR